MSSKYVLGICEIFHPTIHGYNSNSYPNVVNHFLLHTTIDLEDFWDNSYQDCLNDLLEFYNKDFNFSLRESLINHPTIRNYYHILYNVQHLNLDIIEVFELPGNETCACIKTIWLKLLQRKWKRIYKERQDKIKKYNNYHFLMKRQINGNPKW